MWGSPICASRFTQTACSSFGPYGKGLCGRPQAGPARPALAWALAAGALFAAAFGSFYTGLSRIDYSAGAPILGAVADFAGIKKKMLGSFLGLGVMATACMFFIERGDWLLAAMLFVVANIGVTTSFVFYDSLLPHIASADEMDRVSTAGYALGYLGGGLLLAVNLAWIQRPDLFGLGGSELLHRGHGGSDRRE